MFKKIPKGKDWSLIDVEGSSPGSVGKYHEKVQKQIDQSLKESHQLIANINNVPKSEDVIIWFTNVPYSANARDIEDFYKKKSITVRRIFAKDPGMFRAIFDHDNALKLASIPDHVLNNRKMVLRIDKRQLLHKAHSVDQTVPSSVIHPEPPIEQLSKVTEQQQLSHLLKQLKLSELHIEIIGQVKSSNRVS